MKRNQYWFRARYFGRGFYPETWEGWLVSLLYSALVLAAYFLLPSQSGIVFVLLTTVVFLLICRAKGRTPQAATDGKEKGWRAGKLG